MPDPKEPPVQDENLETTEPVVDPAPTGPLPPEPETPVIPEEPVEEPEVPEPVAPSRREQIRIQDILAKRSEAAVTAPKPSQPEGMIDYTKLLDAPDELIERLNQDRTTASESAFQQGLDQSKSLEFRMLLNIDAPQVETRYPQIDPRSEQYNKALADDINIMFLRHAGYDKTTGKVTDPELRYGPYVDSIFALADSIAGEKNQETVSNVTKQAARTGIRPDGSTPKRMNLNQAPEAMSDEELDAVLKQIPKHK